MVFALDKSKPKIEKITRNMQNLKLTCIKPFLWDATKAVRETGEEDEIEGMHRKHFRKLVIQTLLIKISRPTSIDINWTNLYAVSGYADLCTVKTVSIGINV